MPLEHEALTERIIGAAIEVHKAFAEGFRICGLFLKLFVKVYGPLTASAMDPLPDDALLPEHERSTLDQL